MPITEQHIQEMQELHRQAPPELRKAMTRFTRELCDLGDQLQIPPRVIMCMIGGLVGGMAVTDAGTAHNDEGVDDFLELAYRAIQIGTATVRINLGYQPDAQH